MCTLCWHWVFRIEEFCKFEVKEKQYLSLFLNLKDYSRGMLWAYSCWNWILVGHREQNRITSIGHWKLFPGVGLSVQRRVEVGSQISTLPREVRRKPRKKVMSTCLMTQMTYLVEGEGRENLKSTIVRATRSFSVLTERAQSTQTDTQNHGGVRKLPARSPGHSLYLSQSGSVWALKSWAAQNTVTLSVFPFRDSNTSSNDSSQTLEALGGWRSVAEALVSNGQCSQLIGCVALDKKTSYGQWSIQRVIVKMKWANIGEVFVMS